MPALRKPWDLFPALTEEERRAFALVEEQIARFNSWGSIDQELSDEFQQILFRLGDRGIASIASKLYNLRPEDVQSEADAAAVLLDIDALAYFAKAKSNIAQDSIRELALTSIVWNQAGKLVDPIRATLAFEMFDIYSQYHPEAALHFIATIQKQHRSAYFTHYAYGRRLAGESLEAIDQEIRAVFLSPELALK